MCLFCKIANHEIPSYSVYEDEQFYAFLDLSQVTKGHTLLIPKQHSDSLLSCDPQLLAQMLPIAQKIGAALLEKLNASGLNFINNCGEEAGQTILHTHLHIIPRYNESDQLKIEFKPSENPDYQKTLDLINKA